MEHKEIEQAVNLLSGLKGETAVPKNVRIKIDDALRILQGDEEVTTKANKVLSELEEIADDVNLDPYNRTQIWDIISGLEKIKQ